MSVLAPPEPPRLDDPEALIREARERQRRRRIRIAAALAAAGAAGALAYGIARSVGGGAATNTAGPGGPFAATSAFFGHGRLAFVSRGRLYLLDGSARRLVAVTPAGGAVTPSFSPDGRWLAYDYRGRLGIARADGTHAQTFSIASGTWLPDGELLAADALYRISAHGTPIRVAKAPAGLAAWAPDGSRYAYVVTRGGRNGVELLQTAATLNGPRTTWYRIPQRFTPSGGFRTPGIGEVLVLPRKRGLLVWLDPVHSESIAADGLTLYQLKAGGARLHRLGTTVGSSVSAGPDGRLAIGAGFDRIAWTHRTVLTCDARCSPVRAAPPLTLEPAWSPNGAVLAFVGAATESTSLSSISPALRRWYRTRHLWLLARGRAREVPGTTGAATPVWSGDGRSILFVAGDALWLLPRLDARPVKVVGPLFGTRVWVNGYGNVAWTRLFAWQS